MGLLSVAVGILVFVVPGYVALAAKSYWVSSGTGAGEKALESVAWSTVVFIISAALPSKAFDLSSFGEMVTLNTPNPSMLLFSWRFLVQYGCVLAVAFVVGTLWALVTSRGPLVSLTKRSAFARVWDEFWTLNRKAAVQHGLWVEMKDGTIWAGRLRAASDSPTERELWLKNVQIVQKAKQGYLVSDWLLPDLLINSADVSRISVLAQDSRRRAKVPVRS